MVVIVMGLFEGIVMRKDSRMRLLWLSRVYQWSKKLLIVYNIILGGDVSILSSVCTERAVSNTLPSPNLGHFWLPLVG